MWCATRERQPGIRAEEVVHPVLVAGEDHDELVALGLHHLEQDLDRLAAVVALVLGPVEVVRLVDEEHAAVGAAEHLLRLRRRVADVLADEVVARARDDARLARCSRGGAGSAAIFIATVVLPVPGLPVNDMCSDGRSEARPTSARSRSISSSAAISRIRVLTGSERDQLAVELVEHLEDVRLVEGGPRSASSRPRRRPRLVDVVLARAPPPPVAVPSRGRPHAELEPHAPRRLRCWRRGAVRGVLVARGGSG